MRQSKYPVEHCCEINFETCSVTTRPETAEERAARLRRNASKRRGRILRRFQTEGIDGFLYGLCRSLQLAIDEGKPPPLHFNIKYVFKETGRRDTTLIERFSLEEAFTFNDMWTGKATWHVFFRTLKRRKNDEGVTLAFPTVVVTFNEDGSVTVPQPV